ncbi:hypothetical protein OJF2_04680 [Aquisphaera giovannonii]|uniref:Uncharacterized protein n=1 Tax=Aquisphaera giovannonii TaxID=406548 RepID=A0A5B9VV43_9BACT|nr:DUF6624 domain-containing protein [Aquisphaera giovannonii]QEH31999.1 hypothetical protein OJF2_04680 [Aquisphaera giovannonii]
MDEALRRELVAMADEDQATRARLAADGSLFDGYHPEMRAVHDGNAARLAEIIASRGWPGRSVAGEDGSRAAWMILQHAIAQPDFQRRCLVLLQDAASRGEVPCVEVAMLEDRIRVFEGRPQRYGTQYDWDDRGELSPHPIEDAEHVDERREALGLPPMEENTRRMREGAAQDGEMPRVDRETRRGAFLRWAISVGWRRPPTP